jgi:hypothetical protein
MGGKPLIFPFSASRRAQIFRHSGLSFALHPSGGAMQIPPGPRGARKPARKTTSPDPNFDFFAPLGPYAGSGLRLEAESSQPYGSFRTGKKETRRPKEIHPKTKVDTAQAHRRKVTSKAYGLPAAIPEHTQGHAGGEKIQEHGVREPGNQDTGNPKQM